jgi:hypothetical protein
MKMNKYDIELVPHFCAECAPKYFTFYKPWWHFTFDVDGVCVSCGKSAKLCSCISVETYFNLDGLKKRGVNYG